VNGTETLSPRTDDRIKSFGAPQRGQNRQVDDRGVWVAECATQSAYSDPGCHAELFDDVQPTIASVSAMARNLVVHYQASGLDLPQQLRRDVDLRWVEAIVATDQRRHRAPLDAERPVEARVQGCCRDHSLLAIAALRHHHVPARSRVGFASYRFESWHYDHVVVEVWVEGRWRRFDPEVSEPLPALPDPTDIPISPDSPFLTAAQVWLGHRAGLLDVARYGAVEHAALQGEPFVYAKVICELAHRYGDELLLWDRWGAMDPHRFDVPPQDPELIDEVATLLLAADDGDQSHERELLARYRRDARLHPGTYIHSISPTGHRYRVDPSTRTTTRLG
jgi:hypothetical protein